MIKEKIFNKKKKNQNEQQQQQQQQQQTLMKKSTDDSIIHTIGKGKNVAQQSNTSSALVVNHSSSSLSSSSSAVVAASSSFNNNNNNNKELKDAVLQYKKMKKVKALNSNSNPNSNSNSNAIVNVNVNSYNNNNMDMIPLETPSPLRRLADPEKEHVMPSRRRGGGGKTNNNNNYNKMLPPPKVNVNVNRNVNTINARRMMDDKKRTILQEEDYVTSLSYIIERDFFPDIPHLQKQIALLDEFAEKGYISSSSSSLFNSDTRSNHRMSDHDHDNSDSESFISSSSSIVMRGRGQQQQQQRRNNNNNNMNVNVTLNLDQFVNKYTSRDNDDYTLLAEKMKMQHRQKYWWLYQNQDQNDNDNDDVKKLQGGPVVINNKKIENGDDNRPATIETWSYRPKNSLMWEPTLQDSRKICQLDMKKSADILPTTTKLLTNNNDNDNDNKKNLFVLNDSQKLIKERREQPRQTIYSNTRFHNNSIDDFEEKTLKKYSPSPIERIMTNESDSTLNTTASLTLGDDNSKIRLNNNNNNNNNTGYVAMTPLLLPGANGESPMMTYGEIDGTPIILDPMGSSSFHGRKNNNDNDNNNDNSKFKIHERVGRSVIGHRLDAQRKRKRRNESHYHRQQTSVAMNDLPTPPSSMKSTSRITRSSHVVSNLTPAAQRLANRLQQSSSSTSHNNRQNTTTTRTTTTTGSIFGGTSASSLRDSYRVSSQYNKNKRLKSVTTLFSSGVTPSPSPIRTLQRYNDNMERGKGKGKGKGKDRDKDDGSNSNSNSNSNGKKSNSSVTDGLLKL